MSTDVDVATQGTAVPQDLEVMFARLEGRVATLQETVTIQLQHTAEETAAAKRSAKAAHERLDQELRDLYQLIRGLERWRSKAAGILAGITLSSGIVAGVIVWALSVAA